VIQDWLAQVSFRSQPRGVECMCCGEPTFEFYQGDQLIALVGYHHSQLLRYKGWPADAVLSSQSTTDLSNWLASQGLPGPKQALDAQKQAAQRWREEWERATQGFTPEQKSQLQSLVRPGQVIYSQKPGPIQKKPRIQLEPQLMLQVVGASLDDWAKWDEASLECYQTLLAMPSSQLEDNLKEALLSQNRSRCRGACRVWLHGHPDWRPSEQACYRAALSLLDSSRNPEVRAKALLAARWNQPDLTQAELQARLADPDSQVRQLALLAVGQEKLTGLYPSLLAYLNTQRPPSLPLPPVLAEEDLPWENSTQIPEEREAAALACGLARLQSALPHLQPRTPAQRIALALLGQPNQLDPSCFAHPTHRHYATLAVIQTGQGLPLACASELDDQDVALLRQHLLRTPQTPDPAKLRKVENIDQLRAWYRKNKARLHFQARD